MIKENIPSEVTYMELELEIDYKWNVDTTIIYSSREHGVPTLYVGAIDSYHSEETKSGDIKVVDIPEVTRFNIESVVLCGIFFNGYSMYSIGTDNFYDIWNEMLTDWDSYTSRPRYSPSGLSCELELIQILRKKK